MSKTKQQKHDEAEARQTEYDALSTVEKIARTDTRRGSSKRERARLMAATPQTHISTPADTLPKSVKRMPDGTVRPKARQGA